MPLLRPLQEEGPKRSALHSIPRAWFAATILAPLEALIRDALLLHASAVIHTQIFDAAAFTLY